MKSKILFLALVSILFCTTVNADIAPLGGGFKCDGSTILKGTKKVTYSQAKSNLNTTIAKLKEKLADAPKNKKQGIKNKIKAANGVKTLVTSCSKGLLATQVDPIFTNLASGTGKFFGNYSGSVSGFIPLSGTVETTFTLQGTVFSAVLNLGGQLGNSLNFQPLTFSNDVGGIGFPAQFILEGTFLGTVTLSITKEGRLTITNSNAPNGATVNFDGQFSANTITSSISGNYSGFPFQGTANLTK